MNKPPIRHSEDLDEAVVTVQRDYRIRWQSGSTKARLRAEEMALAGRSGGGAGTGGSYGCDEVPGTAHIVE